MEKERNNSAVVYVLELPDCLNLHYFVYFVTDYIDGIEYCTYLMRGEKASKSIVFYKITKILCML